MEYFGISHEDCPTFALYDLESMSKYKPATAQADMSAMFDNEMEKAATTASSFLTGRYTFKTWRMFLDFRDHC